jgi:hypothetical protein
MAGDGGGVAGRSGVGEGTIAQPAMAPRIAAAIHRENTLMLVILLEALGAGLLLVFIVWWTMFHGRSGGERHERGDESTDDSAR